VDLAILVAYGQLVSKELIETFPKGIINIHPSLLPAYRGSTPIESAILDGAAETGVSLMSLAPELDAGPIYDQVKVSLDQTKSKQDLTNQLADLGADLLIKLLPDILSGALTPHNQAETGATYTKRIEKDSAVLDFNKPAIQLEREIRAYYGWPRSITNIGDERVIITKSHVQAGQGEPGQFIENDGKLEVNTAQDRLVIDGLIPSGKKEMSGQAFLAGHKLI
jgi:methionyl-tRNA formyltransferase